MVQIGVDGKRLTIGYAKTEEKAREIRSEAVKRYHREFGA
jgi:hypothetical protein